MIKLLTPKYKQQILEFCYQNERENIFVISSFQRYKKPFSINKYWGYFRRDKLVGLSVFFTYFENFVINAEEKSVINKLVDHAVKENIDIKFIAAFRRHAKPMMDRLKIQHKIKPKLINEEIVLTLKEEDFHDFSTGKEKIATKKDIDDLILFGREMGFSEQKETITNKERKQIVPKNNYIIKIRNKIIATANIHGNSNNYYQIGGVGTKEKHRKKGYAKRTVSSICKHYFKKGIKYGLLFTEKNNIPAHKVYKRIGFKPVDKFIIARY